MVRKIKLKHVKIVTQIVKSLPVFVKVENGSSFLGHVIHFEVETEISGMPIVHFSLDTGYAFDGAVTSDLEHLYDAFSSENRPLVKIYFE